MVIMGMIELQKIKVYLLIKSSQQLLTIIKMVTTSTKNVLRRSSYTVKLLRNHIISKNKNQSNPKNLIFENPSECKRLLFLSNHPNTYIIYRLEIIYVTMLLSTNRDGAIFDFDSNRFSHKISVECSQTANVVWFVDFYCG